MLFHALFVSHFPDSKREKMVSALAIFSCSEKLENIFERGCGDIVKKIKMTNSERRFRCVFVELRKVQI